MHTVWFAKDGWVNWMTHRSYPDDVSNTAGDWNTDPLVVLGLDGVRCG